MTRKILESCPSCGGELAITEVCCTRCETQVRARYRPCDFCALSEEQSTFLRIFLTSRGNLSEVEKRLGVSYPTVRAKLDEVIARLGSAEQEQEQEREQEREREREQAPPEVLERRAILEAVARREIGVAEGLEQIRALGGESNGEL